MFVENLYDCAEFMAGDNTILREILHPDKEDLSLRYSLAHAIVKPGLTSFKHKLSSSEVYYILQGKGLMFIGNEEKEVSVNDTVYIPPDSMQCIKNIGDVDLVFLCIVDPAWREEDETVF